MLFVNGRGLCWLLSLCCSSEY